MKRKKEVLISSIFLLFLVIALPVSDASNLKSLNQKIETSSEKSVSEKSATQNINLLQPLAPITPITDFEDIVGEDILINVDQYQPTVIRTGILEDQGINVIATLSGIPTNPSISIPEIKRIDIRNVEVTTIPPEKKSFVSIGGVRYMPPRESQLTYNNLGFLQIPINRIPREEDVPEKIILDIDARLNFDVSRGLTFGPTKDVLQEQELSEWSLTKENHRFYAGYIQATKVDDDSATFMVYDTELNPLARPLVIKERSKSNSISATSRGYSRYGRVFDRFTISVDDIREASDKVRAYLHRDGSTEYKVLSKGESLYLGSSWYVEDVLISQDGRLVELILRNQNTRQKESLKIETRDIKTETLEKKTQIQLNQDDFRVEDLETEFKFLEEKYQEIRKNVEERKLNSDQIIENYNDITSDVDSFLSEPNLPFPFKQQALRLLFNINSDFLSVIRDKIKDIDLAVTEEKRNELTEEKKKLDTALLNYRAIENKYGEERIVKEEEIKLTNSNSAYEKSIMEYQKLIDQYPGVSFNNKKLDVLSKYRIALINWLYLNNNFEALQNFKELLQYKEEDVNKIIPITEIERYIANLEKLSKYTEATETLEENSKIIVVSLVGAEKLRTDFESKAYIEIDGKGNYYRKNDQLQTFGSINWIVKNIRDKEIEITSDVGGDARQRTVIINLNDKDGEDIPLDSFAANAKTVNVKVSKIELNREVHITISPDIERAFSESHFTLHLPIEKRPFNLPLFSESFDKEIDKTQELIIKLDKIINNAIQIHEYWKKFCFITYITLWVKNLFWFGSGTSALARKKVSEDFRRRYQAEDPSLDCRSLTYEECVFKNQDKFEDDIDKAGEVIEKIQSEDNYDPYKTLGDDYEDDRKDLSYLDMMRKEKKNDNYLRQKYYDLLVRLHRRKIELESRLTFFDKDRFKTYEQNQAIIDSILDRLKSAPAWQSQITGKSNSQIYNEHKSEIFEIYANEKINTEMTSLISDLKNNQGKTSGVAVFTEDLETIRKAEENLFKPKTTTTQVSRLNILKDQDGYYFYSDGNKIPVTDPTVEEVIFPDGTKYDIVNPDQIIEQYKHNPTFTLVESGKSKGKAEIVSVDAKHYVEIEYSPTGQTSNYRLFEKQYPDSPLGSEEAFYIGNLDEQMEIVRTRDRILYNKLSSVKNCISQINKKLDEGRFRRGDVNVVNCAGIGSYSVSSSVPKVGASCTDFMSPTDCRLLFNACDPVICPSSRCNFGGEWEIDNVVQSGIVGSSFLCIKNFPQVVFPICFTGIIAGLQNIRSVLEEYKQCLTTAKVDGRSVGICDRLRSFGICDILWREAIAIFNLKGGLLGTIAGKIFNIERGGEYSSFTQSWDNAIGSLKYFTQNYAKNTFAMYAGRSLPELGAEICKSAIFGKIPGIGDFFAQTLRPESPPQFTAFFDEALYTDITPIPQSIYSVFYHIYAGENQDISYSVFLQTKSLEGQPAMTPYFLVRNKKLLRGDFASENIERTLPSGYQEICVELSSEIYGRKLDCGFGKVSTGFLTKFLTDKFTQAELTKQIDTEEECVPQTGRITTLSQSDVSQVSSLYQIPRALVGTFSTGLLETGIIRKCSTYNPGIGAKTDDWVPVGSCGKDERERDLGTCWLYRPAATNLIQQVSARERFLENLNETARKIAQEASIPGISIISQDQININFNEALQSRNVGKDQKDINTLNLAINLYNEIISSYFIDNEIRARAQFEIAQTYEEIAQILASSEKKPIFEEPQFRQTESETTIAEKECNLNKAYWAIKKDNTYTEVNTIFKRDGQIFIIIEGTNCENKDIKINILDENTKRNLIDLRGNTVINDLSITTWNFERSSFDVTTKPLIFLAGADGKHIYSKALMIQP